MAQIDARHDVIPSQFEPIIPDEEQPSVHMQSFLAVVMDLNVSYWLNESVSLNLLVPYRATQVDASFLSATGELLPEEFESIHHRDEIIQGLGDLQVGVGFGGKLDGLWQGFSYQIKLGLTVPTGSTEPDPFVLGSKGIWHQHMFYGTGTFNPWAELSFSAPLGPVTLVAWSSALVPLYRGDFDYKGSTVVMGTLGVSYPVLDTLSVFANQEVYYETPATWGENEAKNSGRTELLASLGLSWSASPEWSLALSLRKPYASFTSGHQLDIPWAGNVDIAYDF
jgi:hypothetical protein